MHWIDIAIIVTLLVSSGIAIVRGFVKEFISLATWVAAFFICMTFAPKLQTVLPDAISNPLLRQGLAWFLLFVATMIVGGLVNFIVGSMVEKTGLSNTNRALGLMFGLIRGVVIVCALVMLGAFMELTKTDWWAAPKLLPYFQDLTQWIVSFMPDDISEKFAFEANRVKNAADMIQSLPK